MAPTPPNARRAPAEPWRSSITRPSWGPAPAPPPPPPPRAPTEPWRSPIPRASEGPRHGLHTPQRSSRPGGAVALLDHACVVGAPTCGPHTPQRLSHLGGAVALLDHACVVGAPTWPPHPPTLVAPRRSRGAPRSRVRRRGPDMASTTHA